MARIRLTVKNIQHQQATAPNGTLIHWIGTKTCPRKLSEQDITKEGNVTHMAVAAYYGNITCLHCRKEAWAAGIHN